MVICILFAALLCCICSLMFCMGMDEVGKGLKEIDDFFMNVENMSVIEKAMKKKAEE